MEIEQAYREIAPKLQSYLTGNGCSYATACDVVQETFLRLWKRREELADDLHQVSGLAFTIARNYRNDLIRKNCRIVESSDDRMVGEDDAETGRLAGGAVLRDEARPGEVSEETAALKRRLKASLGRMPVQLLETFALSRLGNMSVRDIAVGTGASEANVKVRVHRARELFRACFGEDVGAESGTPGPAGFENAVLRALMMLAAVDGEISKEELSLYRRLSEEFRGKIASPFEDLWESSVRAMAYIGFLSEMLSPDELVREYVRESGDGLAMSGTRERRRRVIEALEQMASADGDYSRIERDCVSALAERID